MTTVVVGAGVSGIHAALTLLERGRAVELWDVGRQEVAIADPGASFTELKARLADATSHFLGPDLEALVPPDAHELLRYPPTRRFLASRKDPLWRFEAEGFDAFGSFACGGLANGWGANALAFDEDDLRGWPVSFAEMEPAYRKVFERVPVAGPVEDDLSTSLNGAFPSQPPVALSPADERMMRAYVRKRESLRRRGVALGLARLAVITDPADPQHACDGCNRCLWGCPRGSIYNPAVPTLQACRRFAGFRYLPDREVVALTARDGRVTGLRYMDPSRHELLEAPCDEVFLAAGALQTGAIFLRTLRLLRPDLAPESEGLMDTDVVKVPYIALGGLGSPNQERGFQFNRLIVGLSGHGGTWPHHLHGEILHLGSLLYHPLIERMPFDSRMSLRAFFALKSALGVATLFFADRIVGGNRMVLADDGGPVGKVRLCRRRDDSKQTYVHDSVKRMRSTLRSLGCLPRDPIASPGGGGIHYAGTVPMGAGIRRCASNGRSNLLSNLYIADGAAFPDLPSKSITMSLAAHATRVAWMATR